MHFTYLRRDGGAAADPNEKGHGHELGGKLLAERDFRHGWWVVDVWIYLSIAVAE
jgi:hypothetical protein